MTVARVSAFQSLRKSALEKSLRYVHWLREGRRDLHGGDAKGFAVVLVLGREHYEERRSRYPIRSRVDLDRVLKLELQGRRATLVHIGPFFDEHREVIFFEIKPAAVSLIEQTLFVVPESLLLAASLDSRTALTVSRDAMSYFVSQATSSQVAGGLVNNVELYALAAGIPADNRAVLTDDRDFRDRFVSGLKTVDLVSWLGFLAPHVRETTREHWRPALISLSGFLILYLLIASAYLQSMLAWREHQLAGLGPEVRELVETQRRIDRVADEHESLARLVKGRWETHRAWEVAGQIWSSGGSFTVINMIGPKITVRGSTGDAATLLKNISAMPRVGSAKFVAPVRQEATGQEFMIEILLKSEIDRGK